MITKNANLVRPLSNQPQHSQSLLLVSAILMSTSLLAFVLDFAGGVILIRDYLFSSDSASDYQLGRLAAQVVSLGLVFVMAWVVALISIHVLKNAFYPLVLRLTAVFVSLTMSALYGLGIYHCYYEQSFSLFKYALVLVVCCGVLAAFYLLTEVADLRFMSLPLIGALVVHIYSLVFHYVFGNVKDPFFILRDLFLIILVVFLLKLMASSSIYHMQKLLASAFARLRKNQNIPDVLLTFFK